MQTRGKFITVEGQDGAGKTTSMVFVERLLGEREIDAVVTREPGGTQLGEKLRCLILEGHELHIDSLAELLMIFAARAQHLTETIEPALSKGIWVLCDRFTDATFAYQSAGRGLPWSDVEILENMVQGSLRPDLTLLIDVDPEIGRIRASQRRQTAPDRFETEEKEFKSNVRRAYLDLARMHPERIRIVDGTLSLNEVEKQVIDIVGRYLEESVIER